MATKEENIQRLRELATRLGRAPDVSGSAAELSQRVMEWEEEAEAEHLPAVENDSDESIVPPGIGQRSERVLIRALRTLHICAIDPDSNRELDMVMAGNPARISQHDVDELISGLFRLTRNRYDYVARNFAGGRGFPVRFIFHRCRCR